MFGSTVVADFKGDSEVQENEESGLIYIDLVAPRQQ